MNDFSSSLFSGFSSVFTGLGTAGKVVLFIILLVLVLPFVLRVLSFFRRGGDGV